jgi:hypothetical protein
MTEKEIGEKLKSIKGMMKWCDTYILEDYGVGKTGQLNENQVKAIGELFKLFSTLNWQIKFNNYKELKLEKDSPLDIRGCGTPVKIRPCKEEYGNKTYFGVLLGDISLGLSASISDDGDVTVKHSWHNPAIFVPELKTVIYGMESWWGRIKSEEDLNELITDDVIKDCWYVKVLAAISSGKTEGEQESKCGDTHDDKPQD